MGFPIVGVGEPAETRCSPGHGLRRSRIGGWGSPKAAETGPGKLPRSLSGEGPLVCTGIVTFYSANGSSSVTWCWWWFWVLKPCWIQISPLLEN